MNKVIIAAIVLFIVFLAGFVPQYAKVNRLDSELRQLRLVNTSAALRELVGLAYFQANQKNYGNHCAIVQPGARGGEPST